MENKEDFYKNLKNILDETTSYPAKYLYKFIVPTDKEKIAKIENIFNYGGAVIDTKSSKKGKYTSISVLIEMQSTNDIIAKYEEVGEIEGVVSL